MPVILVHIYGRCVFMKEKIACIGGSTIGIGWAVLFALYDRPVHLYSPHSLPKALGRAEVCLRPLVGAGLITEEKAARTLRNIILCPELKEAVSGARWIQESASESYEVKEQLLSEIDAVCGADTTVASSSSGLSIAKIAASSRFPERCIAVHPYNPVYLMPLVELAGLEGSAETLSGACAFLKEFGREPVVLKKEAPGFIANRLQIAVQREICHLVYTGVADVEACDKAMQYALSPRWTALGPMLITQLGSRDARTMIETLNPGTEVWLEDMADFKHWPKDWGEVCQQGVDAEMSRRAPEDGQTSEGLRAYRDKMLLKILALQGKLNLPE